MEDSKELTTYGLSLEKWFAKDPAEVIGMRGYFYQTPSGNCELVTIGGCYLEGGRLVVTYSGVAGGRSATYGRTKFARFDDQKAAEELFEARKVAYSEACQKKEWGAAYAALTK